MFGLGFWEILLIAILILLFFGTSRLPEIGRSVGTMVGKFKRASRAEPEPPAVEPPQEDAHRKEP
jgi:sec-independent protein translocase protein TatA